MCAHLPQKGTSFVGQRRNSMATPGLRRLLLSVVILLIGYLCLTPQLVSAQDVSVKLFPESTTLQEPITLSIEVQGRSSRAPNLPAMPFFDVRQNGQKSSVSIINGSFSQITTYEYELYAKQIGQLTIPPITVYVDGKPVQTAPKVVQVVGARQTIPGTFSAPSTDEVFVEQDILPARIYIGQQIKQLLRIYSRVQIGDQIQVGRKPLMGTTEEPLPEQSSQRRDVVMVGNEQYRVEEAVWAFYPVSSGTLEVPSMEVMVPVLEQRRRPRQRSIDPIFDSLLGGMTSLEPRRLMTEPKSLVVLPLPEAGKRPDFTGLVGTFTTKDNVSDTEITLGDSITVTLLVHGEGDLDNLKISLPDSSDAKFYEDPPVMDVSVGRDWQITSRKIFKWAIVPQHVGEIIVPPVQFSYFDPQAEQYTSAKLGPFRLAVQPDAAGNRSLGTSSRLLPDPTEVKILGQDILPAYSGDVLVQNRSLSPFSPVLLGLFLAPIVLFGAAEAKMRWSESARHDDGNRRRRGALKQALHEIKNLKSGPDPRTTLDELSRTFRSYLGARLRVEGAAFTSRDFRQQLVLAKVPVELADELEQYLDQIEQARYAPNTSAGSPDRTLAQALNLLTRIDKALGKA